MLVGNDLMEVKALSKVRDQLLAQKSTINDLLIEELIIYIFNPR